MKQKRTSVKKTHRRYTAAQRKAGTVLRTKENREHKDSVFGEHQSTINRRK